MLMNLYKLFCGLFITAFFLYPPLWANQQQQLQQIEQIQHQPQYSKEHIRQMQAQSSDLICSRLKVDKPALVGPPPKGSKPQMARGSDVPFPLATKTKTEDTGKKANFFEQIKKLTERINGENGGIRRDQLRSLLELPEVKDQKLARQVLYRMTNWGNMANVFEGLSFIQRQAEKADLMYVPLGRGTLTDVFDYLANKQNPHVSQFSSLVDKFDIEPVYHGKKAAVLVDRAMIRLLKQDPELVKQLKTEGVQCVALPGWDQGINPFNQHGFNQVSKQFSLNYQQAKAFGLKSLDLHFVADIKSELTALGLGKNFRVMKYDWTPEGEMHSSFNELLHRMTPKRVHSSDVLAQFGKDILKPEDELRFMNILRESAAYFSIPRLARLAEKVHIHIRALAHERQIPEDQIYLYAALRGKSYQLISYLYANVNGIPIHRIVKNLKDVPDKSLIVMCDDFAGSGDSLIQEMPKHELKNHTIVISPMVSTPSAITRFGENATSQIRYTTGFTLKNYQLTAEYKASTPKERSAYDYFLTQGYKRNGANVSFAYMSPDNNNRIFARHFAGLFTIPRNAIK